MFYSRRLLSKVARDGGFTKVILGHSSSRLSATLLSNMAQGRGAHIAYDTVSISGYLHFP